MSELCAQHCPARQICRSKLETAIEYSGNLRAFKQEFETDALAHGRRIFRNAAIPPELLSDIRNNHDTLLDLRNNLRHLLEAEILCDGPAPSRQGLIIMKDTILRSRTDAETRQKYIYQDATCGHPVGSIILENLLAA